MKKLLTLLTVFTISTTSTTSVISCMPQQAQVNFDFDPSIGKNIDKSNAVDTSVDPESHHGVSNFFTLGDSLSDNGGLVTIAKDELGVNAKMSGLYNNGFSNGKRVAEIINDKLGFEESTFKSSNIIHNADIDYTKADGTTQKAWGRNYSVGGATAYESDGLTGKLLMGNTGIYKQAQALVKQQKINDKDLFLLEIGGNDLFALADARNDYNTQKSIMSNGLDNIKNALCTLINNGAKRILFITPPDILLTPGYNNKNTDSGGSGEYSEDELKKINLLCKEFDSSITKIVNAINEKNDVIKVYNLYQNLKVILDGFISESSKQEINVENNYSESTAFDLGGLDITNIDIKAVVREKYKDKNIDDFFFIDKVHPTAAGHKYVSELVYKLLIDDSFITE
ncbi:hypothetical protein SCORR_v1c05490 [Spiroplasma corruscae]|uniref:Lipolytic enzyme, GDSL family n=1 Tax=Spiroplasma corruscae TaxID=216934 RepID=A0A222EPP0_9MOLU|nr:SGNH/GDSL hydrolase family protein [Spiroplasma corruscae]ASP28321.1 hypothetical protein SCORR_v1c05490 [Spiroplasma corruscae]